MIKVINICTTFLVAVVFVDIQLSWGMKRGPHHPRSEMSKTRKVDQHLTHEEHRIEDDLQQLGINVNPDEMTEEERNFYFFKVHDSDNNNALDGLEMLHAAIHQDDDNFAKLDRESYLQHASQELKHIIDVIDEFLDIADSNKDGYLHYAEYMKAVNENKLTIDPEDN